MGLQIHSAHRLHNICPCKMAPGQLVNSIGPINLIVSIQRKGEAQLFHNLINVTILTTLYKSNPGGNVNTLDIWQSNAALRFSAPFNPYWSTQRVNWEI
jgi:hypothetical protein